MRDSSVPLAEEGRDDFSADDEFSAVEEESGRGRGRTRRRREDDPAIKKGLLEDALRSRCVFLGRHGPSLPPQQRHYR